MSGFEDIKLPDNIDEITNRAISEGEKYIKMKSKKNRNIAMAASLALVALMGIATPALAEKVNIPNNIFEQLKRDDSIGEKDFILKGNHYKYAEAVNQEVKNNGIAMKITEVACDGANIFISYAITMDKPFSHGGYWGILTEDEKIAVDFWSGRLQNGSGIEGKFIDEFNFMGVETIDLAPITSKGIEIPDKFNLEIKIGKLIEELWNDKDKVQYGKNKIAGPWNFKIEVTKNTSEVKEVKKEQVDGEVKFNKIIATPTTTDIELTIPNSYPDGVVVVAHDDNGHGLQPTHAQKISSNDKEYIKLTKFSAVSEGAKFVTIKLVDKNDPELKVLNEFKVPIQ